jgi:hypothetical protein
MLAHASTVDASGYEELIKLFGSQRYNKMALDLREKFQIAQPFSHVVIDNFLPSEVADAVARAYPDPVDASIKWKTHNNANTSREFLEDVTFMSPSMQLFAQALIGRQFLLFLETISGIDCLIADPYFIGGGAMVSGPGDFLKIHAKNSCGL